MGGYYFRLVLMPFLTCTLKYIFSLTWFFSRLLMMALGANVAHAENTKIHVVTEYFQNYQLKTESGQLSGFAVEVVEALFDKTEFTADISALPWSRALKIAKEEKNTLIFSIARTKSRQKYFTWIGILSSEPQFVWALKDRFPNKFLQQEELIPYHFVVIRNTNPEDMLTERGFTNLVRVSSESQLVGMLYKHRADFIASGESVMRNRLRAQGYAFSDITPVYNFEDLSTDLGLAFNINTDPKIITVFQKAFLEMQQSGELSNFKEKWNINY